MAYLWFPAGGLIGKSLSLHGDELSFWEFIDPRKGRDPCEPQFLDEPFPGRAGTPLVSPLGLRRMRRDTMDVEFTKHRLDLIHRVKALGVFSEKLRS